MRSSEHIVLKQIKSVFDPCFYLFHATPLPVDEKQTIIVFEDGCHAKIYGIDTDVEIQHAWIMRS